MRPLVHQPIWIQPYVHSHTTAPRSVWDAFLLRVLRVHTNAVPCGVVDVVLAFLGIMVYVISSDIVLVVGVFVGAGMTAQIWVFVLYCCVRKVGHGLRMMLTWWCATS